MKGGHATENSQADESSDLLISKSGEEWFTAARINTKNTHGTGCSLSSAIAANLAKAIAEDGPVLIHLKLDANDIAPGKTIASKK